jgi:hypothetical protein
MNDLDASTRPRRVVLDVAPQVRVQDAPGPQHKRRRRRKKKKHDQQFDPFARDPRVGQLTAAEFDHLKDAEAMDPTEHIPMELRPLIQEALAYGRKTHVLGVMKAANVLSNIAVKLRTSQVANDSTVRQLINEAEEESNRIVTLFGATYNDEQEAMA